MGSADRKQPGNIIFRHITTANSPGMYAALHSHNYYELIYVVSGNIAHVVEGRKYLLGPGDLALVAPSKYHYLQILSDEPYERYNILFDLQEHGIFGPLQLPADLEAINLSGIKPLYRLFSKMDYYIKAGDEHFQKFLTLLLNELCLNLTLLPQGTQQKETVISPMLTQILEYINANLFTIEDVEEVAGAMFISSSYLYRLFRTSMHQSPKKYIQDKRLLAAQRMLRAGQKPTAVSRECGFREYSTFYRSYSSFFGHEPSSDFQKE